MIVGWIFVGLCVFEAPPEPEPSGVWVNHDPEFAPVEIEVPEPEVHEVEPEPKVHEVELHEVEPESEPLGEEPFPPRPFRGPASRRPGPAWKRWAAPLASAFLPGVGQAINRQPGKATLALAGTATLIGATVGLQLSKDPRQNLALGIGESSGAHIARLGASSALTSALMMLYVWQIADAYAVAVGKWPVPRRHYKVNVDFARMSTVGLRPGGPGYALYDDFSLAVMGQVAPKIGFGLADLSLKIDERREQYTLQAGVRTMWRFAEPGRWWFSVGGGLIVQGSGAAPLGPTQGAQRRFGAIPYLLLEGRWFVLDRLSLNFAPRVSVPLTDRDYRTGRIPRYATTFELGTGLGVHF